MGNRLYQSAFNFAAWASAATDFGARTARPQDILVLTAYTRDIAAYGAMTAENKAEYARQHGYAFRVLTAGFVAERPPAWSKIRFIEQALADFEWVFWSDADSLVMNYGQSLESLITRGQDLLLTEALTPYRHINTGSMLIHRSWFSRLFLRAVWRLEAFTHDPSWEQRAVNHLLANYHLPRIRIAPNRLCNAFGEVPDDPDPYRPGDFIIHFPGRPNKPDLIRRYHGESSRLAANVPSAPERGDGQSSGSPLPS